MVSYGENIKPVEVKRRLPKRSEKALQGVDVFIDWVEQDNGRNPEIIGKGLEAAADGKLKLKMITNRGQKVYPNGHPETFCTDHWRCRFYEPNKEAVDYNDVMYLLQKVYAAGFDVIKTENLYTIDGERGYSLGQGE